MAMKNMIFAAFLVALCSVVSCTNYARTSHVNTQRQLTLQRRVHQQVVPSFNYLTNQPSVYNGAANMQYFNYVPKTAGHAQFIGNNVQYRKNGVHGYGKQANPALMSTPAVQRGFYSNSPVFGVPSLPFATPMYPGGYGSAFYNQYPQESLLDKAGNFIGNNLPLLLAGSALYAVAKG